MTKLEIIFYILIGVIILYIFARVFVFGIVKSFYQAKSIFHKKQDEIKEDKK